MTTANPEFIDPDTRAFAHALSRTWWLWLVMGILWLIAAVVILQFDQASIKTIGWITGIMFMVVALQNFALAALADRLRWLWAIFGVLFVIAGIVCFINPEETFAGIADILGFLFLMIAVWWAVRAFVEREFNDLWWIGLIGAVLMLILAFWTGGQFYITKAYTLIVFAGIWALMQGITDLVRAFQVRRLRDV